jgi:hypothetical protein
MLFLQLVLMPYAKLQESTPECQDRGMFDN